MFWILTSSLFFIAMLFVLVPLLRIGVRVREQQNDDEDLRKETNIKLFKEREVELQAELSLNHIDEKQFNDLILELKQNLLADVMIDAKGSKILSKGKSTSVQTGDNRVFFSKNILVPVLSLIHI